MSLSNQTTTTNPAKRFMKWKGISGDLVYWDSENKKEITVKRPFKFAVLDELSCISGFSESDNQNIYSNEVKSTATEKITVKVGGGTLMDGLYVDIKDRVKSKGGKYTKSVYIGTDIDGVLSIANIKFSGAGFSSWIDFTKQGSIYNNWTVFTNDTTEGKKGATVFQMPVFTAELMGDDDRTKAIDLDKELQKYLETKTQSHAPDRTELTDDEQITHDNVKQMFTKDVVLEDIDDKPIDLSEIPF